MKEEGKTLIAKTYPSSLTPHRHTDPCVCSLCIHVYFILFPYFFTTQVLDLHMEEMILDGSLQRIWYPSQTPTLALSHTHHNIHSHALRTLFHTYLSHRDKHVVRQHDKGFVCPPSAHPRSLHTGIRIRVSVHYASMFDCACVFLCVQN
jgi:hypothetical protein